LVSHASQGKAWRGSVICLPISEIEHSECQFFAFSLVKLVTEEDQILPSRRHIFVHVQSCIREHLVVHKHCIVAHLRRHGIQLAVLDQPVERSLDIGFLDVLQGVKP
jgi:hypothetical protein